MHFDDIQMTLSETITSLQEELTSQLEEVKGTLEEEIGYIFEAIGESITTKSDELYSYIEESIDGIVTYLTETSETYSETFGELGANFIAGFFTGISTAFDENNTTITKKAQSIIDTIYNTVTGSYASDLMVDAGDSAIYWLVFGIQDGFDTRKEKIQAKFEKITTIAENKMKIEKFQKIGRHMIKGLYQGMKEKWGQIKDKVNEMWGKVTNSAKEAFDVHSPSKVFESQSSENAKKIEHNRRIIRRRVK